MVWHCMEWFGIEELDGDANRTNRYSSAYHYKIKSNARIRIITNTTSSILFSRVDVTVRFQFTVGGVLLKVLLLEEFGCGCRHVVVVHSGKVRQVGQHDTSQGRNGLYQASKLTRLFFLGPDQFSH